MLVSILLKLLGLNSRPSEVLILRRFILEKEVLTNAAYKGMSDKEKEFAMACAIADCVGQSWGTDNDIYNESGDNRRRVTELCKHFGVDPDKAIEAYASLSKK